MGDEDDIFVKRVDFDVNDDNNNINSNDIEPTITSLLMNGDMQSDVEKSKKPVEKPTTCCGKFNYFLDKFGIKAAFSHIGLLIGLGLYCWGGGLVRNSKLRIGTNN